jgi:quercetin dioxygenase-like cupin family protein
VVRPGQELTDRDTGARLRFVRTAASSGGEAVTMVLEVRDGWSAGPPHVHPQQTERMRVLEGRFRSRCGGEPRVLCPGEVVEVPPGTAHAIELVTTAGRLEAEFSPALRTDELFEAMFAGRWPRRPPGFVPGALRAWWESRGFGAEIRYLWPRRLVFALALTASAALTSKAVRTSGR